MIPGFDGHSFPQFSVSQNSYETRRICIAQGRSLQTVQEEIDVRYRFPPEHVTENAPEKIATINE